MKSGSSNDRKYKKFSLCRQTTVNIENEGGRRPADRSAVYSPCRPNLGQHRLSDEPTKELYPPPSRQYESVDVRNRG